MDYQCVRCGHVAPAEEWIRGKQFKCPMCSYRVAKKIRPFRSKRVKAT